MHRRVNFNVMDLNLRYIRYSYRFTVYEVMLNTIKREKNSLGNKEFVSKISGDCVGWTGHSCSSYR